MSEEIVAIKTYTNEIDATMAQEVLKESGITAFIFKDDAGGMEPHLQRTSGVQLIVNRDDAERAYEMLQALESSP